MKHWLGKYRYSLIILRELVKTDFKLRYQGSILGIAWSVLKPLLLFAVMYTVFVRFLRFTDGTRLFPVSLLLGLGLWQFFSESTVLGLRSIVERGDVLRKIHFPSYIVVISSTIGALISLVINMFVVLIFALINQAEFTWRVLLVPLNLVQYYLLALGMTLLLSCLYVRFRDVGHIWEVVMQALFYGIPIFYPLSMVSEKFPWVANLMLLNPIAQIIQDIRHNLVDPVHVPTVWTELDHWGLSLIPLGITAAVFLLGVYSFRKHSRTFTEIM